jgi:membrane fusion protein (multidrug efflux system)
VKKQMITMLVLVGILFGLIFGWKIFVVYQTKKAFAKMGSSAVTVSTMKVETSLWQPNLRAVGSLRALIGVEVTTELPGMVEGIYFAPGSEVEKGKVLVQLNAATEIGQLHSLEAQVELAKITFERDKAQFAAHAVAKQVVDADEWTLKNLQAQVERESATLLKKTISAPFTGRVGINKVNPGQYLNVGDTVTTLQALDPIYVDFFLPQQTLSRLKVGDPLTVISDAYPGKQFIGKISTVQPKIEVDTRNVEVEGLISNPDRKLTPGMFVNVEIETGEPTTYLTLPQTAISFNPYGDLVYRVEDSGKKDDKNQPILIVKQVFVTIGDTRGDQIAILSGLKPGDIVVTSGQLKLKNGSRVVVNNSVKFSDEAAPKIIER